MVSCHDVDRLMTPYLDAEVEGPQRRAIDEHLSACQPCARRAKAEAAARRVLMIKSSDLCGRAPARLRERCAALAPRPARQPRWSLTGWRRLSAVSATAAVLLVAGVLAIGISSHSPTLLAAELSLDHMKCFALFEPKVAQADAKAVARQLEADYGWRFGVPESRPALQLSLLGARRCFSTDGSVAHVLYRHAGRAVSLFMMRRTTNPAARVGIGGRVATIWSRRDTTYVLLGDETEADLQPIAEYFKAVSDGALNPGS